MLKTTIRWRNVARAGAIGAAVLGAIATLPTLLAPPDPKPLPADVGLDGATVGAQAFAPADVSSPAAPPDASDGRENRPTSKPEKRGALSVGGERDHNRNRDPRSAASRGRDLAPPLSVGGGAPAGTPDSALEPQPTPVSAPTSPPSDPASPPAPPEPDPDPQPSPQPAAAGDGNHAQSARGAGEFGFEQ